MIRESLRLGVFLIAGVAVTGCGGGGGSSGGPDPAPANSPPTADAGADRTVDELALVVLSGSARDRDGTIRTYQWTQISGPEVELENADTAEARFTAPDGPSGSAELSFRLTVTDDKGAAAGDEVSITVADEGAVKVSGAITFDYVPATMSEGLRYGATEARPVHGVTVELRGGAENENTDEYDRTLIAHEWSHYLHASFSRNDTLSGPHDPLFDHLEIATAFSEGLASALGAVVSGDAAYMNTFGPQQGVTEGFSVENTTHTGRGWFIEASIAQIVYDLIDPVNDDTVELGFGQVLEVLTDDLRDTRSLTSIFSFIHELKNRVPDHAPAIDSILAYHRIQPIVDEWGSTETNTGGKAIPEVLPVYAELAVNGVPVNGCSVDSYGAIRTGRYNKLGIHRYFRFWADSEGDYSVAATLTSAPPGKRAWPIVRLRTAGRNTVGNSATCAPEDHGNCTVTAVFNEVPAGDNVLALWDGGNSQTSDSNRGKMCFDVEVARQ